MNPLPTAVLYYTDPGTGKKAVINYLPVLLEWNMYGYDRLYVYLLSGQAQQFMRLTGSDENIQKTDELMQYKAGMHCLQR